MNEEGGAGEEPLLSNPEMSYFKMLSFKQNMI